jgi:SpoVK/Ycf46/Vps4 family AAA+-type ATPase
MKLHVIRPMQEPEKFKGLAGPPRGVLFKGPPGCGKTLVAQAVASEVGSGSFIYVSSGQIMSKWYGESEKAVEALFWLARERSPSIIFLDEAESFFPQDSSEMSNRVANVFKVCMDGFMRNREQMVIVVAATNHEELIDQAVLSRLDTRVSFPKPNSALISSLLMRAQCELNGIIVSPGLSDEELVNLLDESGDQDECALEQDVRSIESRVGRFLRKLISLGIRELNEK